PGLDLLPVRTTFSREKEVHQVSAWWGADQWLAYEIHMGRTETRGECEALLQVQNGSELRGEGCCRRNVWGTYVHGLFESAGLRTELATRAGLANYHASPIPWREHLQTVYGGMADLVEEHLNLEELWRYVES
nr:cobyric acid synthase [Verrucomicrobiota bacterium]